MIEGCGGRPTKVSLSWKGGESNKEKRGNTEELKYRVLGVSLKKKKAVVKTREGFFSPKGIVIESTREEESLTFEKKRERTGERTNTAEIRLPAEGVNFLGRGIGSADV